MSDPCRDWRGALGAAALGAIDPAEEIGLRAHLDGCATCRAELRELTAVARALDAISTPTVVATAAEPSGALVGRVLDRLARERAAVRTRRVRVALIGAATFAAAAAAVIAAVFFVGGSSGPAGTRIALPGVGNNRAVAGATATLRPEPAGVELDVKVWGLHPGDYYWFWVTGDDGHRIPAGTFQGSNRPTNMRLTAALPLSEARRIWVTDTHDRVVLDARVPIST